ncbi:hypothetical protein O6H91_05G029200 [Diphasiastrum complanatum]|uniref:Uncharacterized protein n=1 Tax=Diphasiastrum complanatum TaxID=34168 RepID=A0ACC2DM64_DIPCM|nr:hypothetical protein O6H91_05G029200 [Diphasiastrum complanatum]
MVLLTRMQTLPMHVFSQQQQRPPLSLSHVESQHLLTATHLADASAGITAPHPNAACVLAHGSRVVGDAFLYAEGGRSAEIQAVERAREHATGSTAYLNLEPGDCHGDDSPILALKQHFRGKAITALRKAGIIVDVLGEDTVGDRAQEALEACQYVNIPLLYTATHQLPFSVLKYAMTLDGKIATSTGHSSWVSSKLSRQRVLETRGRSNAVIVGGNTVRRDDPRLTARQENCHSPVRIVMSRGLDLPEEANLWDVSITPTIVMTQRGARNDLQKKLASKGVEIVEFDFLTPRDVMNYCYDCGFLSVLWECGGTLSAPAISAGVIHKVMAFVAPKIIGGVRAPSPVGELGFLEMTQALKLSNVSYEQVGPDLLISGYLYPIPGMQVDAPMWEEAPYVTGSNDEKSVIYFHKTWGFFGAFSTFSPHPVSMENDGKRISWHSVEHYYQAQKFNGVKDRMAEKFAKDIQAADCPEKAAWLGKNFARQHPDLLQPDWQQRRTGIMYEALAKKFSLYPDLRNLLLSTNSRLLVNSSPFDVYWGCGRNGMGLNQLGKLLMKLRAEFEAVEIVKLHKSSIPKYSG